MELPREPRSMRHNAVREARRRMLYEPHIAPLMEFRRRLEADGLGEVPLFDPLDGGVNARVVFLLEKPGPKTSSFDKKGSGFISRDNDDPSAAHSFKFHQDSGLDRRETLLWNIIPWWDGEIRFTAFHRRLGVERVMELLSYLKRVDTIVLVGGTAHKAEKALGARGFRILKSWHPSMRVKNSYPEKFKSIGEVWRQAASPAAVPSF